MQIPDYVLSYRALLSQLVRDHGRERAMELIVGGDYLETGALEAAALKELGLKPDHTLVDVGCGSGRFAFQLRGYFSGEGKYIGTDLLDEALDYAREKCARPDWEFIANHLSTVPVPDATADFVTFFSVFTHLLDEDIFKFLRDARRAVKPDGKIVFSFLDYGCDAHWPLFLKTVEDQNPQRVLNKFITPEMIRRWARALGLRVERLYDGAEPWVRRAGSVEPGGNGDESRAAFGQSVAVLGIFPEAAYLKRYPDVASAVAAGVFHSAAHHYDVCGFREGRGL
jgi:ubiquinone/menaquinone biosynthesis C-methylase UbiE